MHTIVQTVEGKRPLKLLLVAQKNTSATLSWTFQSLLANSILLWATDWAISEHKWLSMQNMIGMPMNSKPRGTKGEWLNYQKARLMQRSWAFSLSVKYPYCQESRGKKPCVAEKTKCSKNCIPNSLKTSVFCFFNMTLKNKSMILMNSIWLFSLQLSVLLKWNAKLRKHWNIFKVSKLPFVSGWKLLLSSDWNHLWFQLAHVPAYHPSLMDI